MAVNIETSKIPGAVVRVLEVLHAAGFESYVVGGCVRDLLLGIEPGDWDVATNAKPDEIRNVFPESFYENKFFTVTVKTGDPDPRLAQVEVTTFRSEGGYRDHRRPEYVKPAKTIEEDLSRRDFTVNAIALRIETLKSRIQNLKLIDPFEGRGDIEARVIRAVGQAEERFGEDALRMLRAVRLAAQLDFTIDQETAAAIRQHADELSAIAKERIRDEFSKLLSLGTNSVMPDGGKNFGTIIDVPGEKHAARSERVREIGGARAWRGLELLHELGLLRYIIPELEEGIGCTQNKHHIFTVWEHNCRALDFAVRKNFHLAVRMSALLHDVAKPRAKRGEGPDSTFYGHDVMGAKMAMEILSRLRYPEAMTEKIAILIRWHLFRYDFEGDPIETTDSAVRRLIRNVGVENIEDLVRVRMCDRIGSGVPKAVPYRLRHFQYRVEKVLREAEAVKVTMLAIRGDDVMRVLGIAPGPKVGHILNALLEEVLDDPTKNRKDYLLVRAEELGKLADDELTRLREKAEARIELLEDQREAEIKKKYFVK